ncbi:fasciclin domain-containing protein [Kitasatospora sp. NPDC056138]|uniref:fasciclin domain-containing protein n=1 Tax=Kitasatospora sp. NPDC056138 TaxID=3345724 RepID=UPI0035DAD09B
MPGIRTAKLAALLASGVLAFTLGACGGTVPAGRVEPAGRGTGAPPTVEPAARTAVSAPEQPFGPACPDAAERGAAASEPVVTAASRIPRLSILVAAIGTAGLTNTLDSAQAVTLFAPTDDAFAKLSGPELHALLADRDRLAEVVTYHVVPRRVAPTALAGAHPTLQGGDLVVTGAVDDFAVNGGARVVCGDIGTANATVYLVDTLLVPPARWPPAPARLPSPPTCAAASPVPQWSQPIVHRIPRRRHGPQGQVQRQGSGGEGAGEERPR